jgi:hypothetical protein
MEGKNTFCAHADAAAAAAGDENKNYFYVCTRTYILFDVLPLKNIVCTHIRGPRRESLR